MKLEAGEARRRTRPLSSSGLGHAPKRNRRRPHLLELGRRVLGDPAPDPRPLERPRADRVHEHAVRRELERCVPDDVDDRGLARGVPVADDRFGAEARVRGRDDDPPGSLTSHDGGRVLHREEDAVQVDAQDLVPVRALDRVDVLAALDGEPRRGRDAGVGDDDVQPALGRHGVVDQRLNLALVGDVEDERARGRAAVDQLCRHLLDPLGVDVGQRDVRATVRKHLGHREAEPARRAGDDDARPPDVEDALLHARRLGHGTSTARPVMSPPRSASSTSLTSSSGCVSLRNTISPRPWS